MTDAEKIIRGNEAKFLQNNSLLKAVFEAVERDCVEGLKKTVHGQDGLRTGLIERMNAIQAIRDELQSIVNTGNSAERKASEPD